MAIIGLGNVGSQVAYHLNLMGCPLILIDNGRVEEANFGNQGFTRAHLGASKVQARAAQLTALNPDCKIRTLDEDIAMIGPGQLLGSHALFSCLDNWYARSALHEMSWELGIPLIDCGLDGTGERFYGRVASYNPGMEDSACMFCTWDRETLKLMLQQDRGVKASCSLLTIGPKKVTSNPTLMPSSMGGVIAGIQVIQTLKLLFDPNAVATASQELIVDLSLNQLSEVKLQRNPNCIFDHAKWPTKLLKENISQLKVQELFQLAMKRFGPRTELLLHRKHLAAQLMCRKGHVREGVYRIIETFPADEAVCDCGERLLPTARDLIQHLDQEQARQFCNKTWQELGLARRDIITAQNEKSAVHYIFS